MMLVHMERHLKGYFLMRIRSKFEAGWIVKTDSILNDDTCHSNNIKELGTLRISSILSTSKLK